MTPELVIEYPTEGESYSHDEYGVYRYDLYPESSVLGGSVRRSFLDSFATLPEAKAAYPNATYSDSGYQEAPPIPHTPPAWFDPTYAGESWDDES